MERRAKTLSSPVAHRGLVHLGDRGLLPTNSGDHPGVHHHHRVHRRGDPGLGSLLLLLHLLGQLGNLVHVLLHQLDDERHHEVKDLVPPRQLQRHIRPHQVVARVQAGRVAFMVPVVNKEPQQLLGQVLVLAFRDGLHRVLVHLVLLRQLHGLLPLLVTLVDVGRDSAELQQLVLLQLLRQCELIKVVVLIDRQPQSLVVLLLDVQLVQSLVDALEVAVLHGLQELLPHGQLGILAQLQHHPLVVHTWGDRRKQIRQLPWGQLNVEVNGLVAQLHAAHLGQSVLEDLVVPGLRGVSHHELRRIVKLVVVSVQEPRLCPMVVLLADSDELVDVDATVEQLDVLHQALRAVLRVQHAQLREHAHVGPLVPQPSLHQSHQLLEVAALLVEPQQLLQLVRLHNDVQGAHLRQPELLGLHAGRVHLLPRPDAVGLARSVHSGVVVLQPHQGDREPSEVGDAGVQNLRGLVQRLVEASVGNVLHLGHVGGAEELLQVSQAVRLGVGVHQLRVDYTLLNLGLRAGHNEVAHKIVVVACLLCCGDDLLESRGVQGLQIRIDCVRDLAGLQLGVGQGAPHGCLPDALGKLVGPLQGVQVVQEHPHGLQVVAELLVDGEGLLEEVRTLRDLRDVRGVVVVQAVNIVHHAVLGRLNGGEDEQVLEVAIVLEFRVAVQDDLLQQLRELVRKVCRHEGLHRGGDLLRHSRLRQRGLHHLVDQQLAVGTVHKHFGPQLGVLALHKIPGLLLEHAVLVGDLDELPVALPALVRREGQNGVAVLAVLPQSPAVVVWVASQEFLGVLVGVDVDLAQSVVQHGLLVALRGAGLQPALQDLQPIPLLHLLHQGLHGAHAAHGEDEVLDVLLRHVAVQQGPGDHRGLHGVSLLHKHVNVLQVLRVHEVPHQLLQVVVLVAHVDQWPQVRQPGFLEEVLGALRLVHAALTSDPFHLAVLPHSGRRLDVTEVHLRILAEVHN
eukprot:RCo005161